MPPGWCAARWPAPGSCVSTLWRIIWALGPRRASIRPPRWAGQTGFGARCPASSVRPTQKKSRCWLRCTAASEGAFETVQPGLRAGPAVFPACTLCPPKQRSACRNVKKPGPLCCDPGFFARGSGAMPGGFAPCFRGTSVQNAYTQRPSPSSTRKRCRLWQDSPKNFFS